LGDLGDYFLPFQISKLDGVDLGFFRIGGPGLGNLLFPIARAALKSRDDNTTFLWPTLRQIKIGPFLRGEKDPRLYGDIFIRRNILEIIKYLILRYTQPSKVVFIHVGLGDFFSRFTKSDSIYLKSLFKRRMRKTIKLSPKICVHIRRGDFSKSSAPILSFNALLDISWFDKRISQLLAEGAKKEDIVIYASDIDQDISWLINKHDLKLSQNNCPLNTILEMSGAEIIIPSLSTFSLWSIFLGDSKFILPVKCDLLKYMNDDMKSRGRFYETVQ
jgi:hypothetical protein